MTNATVAARQAITLQEAPLSSGLMHGGRIPLISPEPPRLSRHATELEAIETSHIFSNYGPVNTRFEEALLDVIFSGAGQCMTVCNATIGLMLAIREVIGDAFPQGRRYALMPSFTFAATGQAALWCGLTPLFCDIDADTWLPDPKSEENLLEAYGEQIAVVVPYATFGNNLDLDHYDRLSRKYGVPIVVDAAASLGSLDINGQGFGTGFHWPVVFSMHATKAFAVGEGGIIYCGDTSRLQRLRAMGSFGFLQDRSAERIGLNSKVSEVTALTAHLQLQKFPQEVAARELLRQQYLQEVRHGFTTQRQRGVRQTLCFQPVLLPRELVPMRAEVLALLRSRGIGAGSYFSPHLAEQPLFACLAEAGVLTITSDVASRVVSLPLFAGMTAEQVKHVVTTLADVLEHLGERIGARTGVERSVISVREQDQLERCSGVRGLPSKLMKRCEADTTKHLATAAAHCGR